MRTARARRGWLRGQGVRLPMVEITASDDGPQAVIVANLHGDECTGLGVAHALVARLPGALSRGRVVLVPSLNPEGMVAGSRTLPGQRDDLNRSFPGDPRGSPLARHAARIWHEITSRRPDLVIDLHTDSGGAIPYAIVDRVVRARPEAQDVEARCVLLAAASGLTVLREYPADEYLRSGLDHSLSGALLNHRGISTLTLEVGPRRRIDPLWVQVGAEAALGVLRAAGMVSVAASPPHPSRRGDGPWRRAGGPRCRVEGVLVPLLGPGVDFARGQPLCEIRTLGGEVREVLRSRRSGFIVALPELAHAPVGTSCATIAVREGE